MASGNVILNSDKGATAVQAAIEQILPEHVRLDRELIKVLALTRKQLEAIITNKPDGFGEQPETYHSDVIFLMGMAVAEAMPVFHPREGVDIVWPGDGVIYLQRLSALRTKSRLNRIIGTPAYQCMTIRSWSTTDRLLDLLEAADSSKGVSTGTEPQAEGSGGDRL